MSGIMGNFQTPYDIETCRARLAELSTPIRIATGIGQSQTKLYLTYVTRRLDRKNNPFIDFRVDADLEPFYPNANWNGHTMNFVGHVTEGDNNSRLVTGKIILERNFLEQCGFEFVLSVLFPSIWFLCGFSRAVSQNSSLVSDYVFLGFVVLIPIYLLILTIILVHRLRPIIKCRTQLIAAVHEALST